MPLILLAVFLGGAAGTGLRFAVDILFPAPSGFPVATLAINLLGSFALGVLVGWLWPAAPHWLRAALGPGFLGGFTTFSAVTLAAITLPPPIAVAYLAASFLGGFAAALAGLRLGHARRSADEIGPEQ
ncbi:CrcB family protein [Diaminobutyricimonas sp. TR449]|uniref:fluoride efflux transporter FluC n=1 Tax=Diaminobutyricimonas sp. TR449 TaxID=2708076 RepID=UPI001FB8BC7F|nr:CrcB family protein [Diaminobutyricimonas sp. TR449]